jgi:hypothetical protein
LYQSKPCNTVEIVNKVVLFLFFSHFFRFLLSPLIPSNCSRAPRQHFHEWERKIDKLQEEGLRHDQVEVESGEFQARVRGQSLVWAWGQDGGKRELVETEHDAGVPVLSFCREDERVRPFLGCGLVYQLY